MADQVDRRSFREMPPCAEAAKETVPTGREPIDIAMPPPEHLIFDLPLPAARWRWRE